MTALSVDVHLPPTSRERNRIDGNGTVTRRQSITTLPLMLCTPPIASLNRCIRSAYAQLYYEPPPSAPSVATSPAQRG